MASLAPSDLLFRRLVRKSDRTGVDFSLRLRRLARRSTTVPGSSVRFVLPNLRSGRLRFLLSVVRLPFPLVNSGNRTCNELLLT